MATINVSSLQQSLSTKIKRISYSILVKRVNTLVYGKRGLYNIALNWLEETKAILSRPASSRGYYGGKSNSRLLPNNTENPMMITGSLMRSLSVLVIPTVLVDTAHVKVIRNFSPVLNKYGKDYSNILNTKHPTIGGFKERAFKKLDQQIALRLANRGYK